MDPVEDIRQLLHGIYGEEKGNRALERIMPLIENFPRSARQKPGYFSQEDVVLITYGDTLSKQGEMPLATLHDFAK